MGCLVMAAQFLSHFCYHSSSDWPVWRHSEGSSRHFLAFWWHLSLVAVGLGTDMTACCPPKNQSHYMVEIPETERERERERERRREKRSKGRMCEISFCVVGKCFDSKNIQYVKISCIVKKFGKYKTYNWSNTKQAQNVNQWVMKTSLVALPSKNVTCYIRECK